MWWSKTLLVGSLIVALVTPGCGGDDSADPLTTATELADTWIEGWSVGDPDAVASVFTEDGEYGVSLLTYQGRDEIAELVEERGSEIENGIRVGDVSEADDGTYVWSTEFDFNGVPSRGTVSFELDGDLASRVVWVDGPVPLDR